MAHNSPLLTINDFWLQRLHVRPVDHTRPLVKGWSYQLEPIRAFQEAPLTSAPVQGDDLSPWESSLLLVSAPGAVGKSTLARQIAYLTGAVYVDLADASPVGGHAITGGLAQSGLYDRWLTTQTTLLIDGLDEARLRVTQEAFEAFLADISQLSADRHIPAVLFGRTAAIQDAWISLVELPSKPATLEIGFYEASDAEAFVESRLRISRPDTKFRTTEQQAISGILSRLRQQTEVDDNRFAGYAPVLQAVADRVASEPNASALLSTVESDDSPITLSKVVRDILERDRGKLKSIPLSQPDLIDKLYTPEEQLGHCVARVYGVPPPAIPEMTSADSKVYSDALSTWVPDHPFLNGNQPSSVVFDAVIAACALRSGISNSIATERELMRGAAANPFLSEFYFAGGIADGVFVPPEHLGIVYASLRSRLTLGERASLSVDGSEDEDDAEVAFEAEAEISVTNTATKRTKVVTITTSQIGVFRLTNYVDDVELSLPLGTVDVGPGSSAVFIAPIDFVCQRLTTPAQTVIIERSPMDQDSVVYLETECFVGAQIASIPVLRGGVTLKVAWPGDKIFPWTSFATAPTAVSDPKLQEALRRFRKFITAFRSHSKGSLARYQRKIEHARMTKGSGQAVLNLLKSEGIVVLVESMYYLNANKLGEITGATYADCVARQFSERTLIFVSRIFL